MLVDSHCHLDFKDFDNEREAVIARARAAGVRTMLSISARMMDFPKIQQIAAGDPDIWCTVGLHPHETEHEARPGRDLLVALAEGEKVIGIGESGLDYYYDHSDRAVQRQSFAEHIEAARDTGLPLIVHTRNADADTGDMLAAGAGDGRLAGLLHCFSSSPDLAKRAVDFGFYISFSGILTFKNAESVREAARVTPLDRLLVETDAPYLSPVPLRGKRNEQSFMVHTARALAAVKGVSEAELARITTDNFFRLFGKAKRPALAA
jgi:TatD DNase family protein